MRRAVVELVARLPTQVGQRVAQVASRVSGGALADVVASTFMQEPAQRFEVLNETDVRLRMEIVTEELLMLVGHLKPRKARRADELIPLVASREVEGLRAHASRGPRRAATQGRTDEAPLDSARGERRPRRRPGVGWRPCDW